MAGVSTGGGAAWVSVRDCQNLKAVCEEGCGGSEMVNDSLGPLAYGPRDFEPQTYLRWE